MPDHHTIRNHKYLKRFGTLLHDPNLWHLNRRSVSGAFAIGLFVAFLPIPLQMAVAAALAIAARVNLPIAASLVWITNPLTMGPLFYFAYKIGAWVLRTETRDFTFEASFDWMMTELGAIWAPFLLGCLLMGMALAVAGYFSMHLLWRLHVAKYLKRRKQRTRNQR